MRAAVASLVACAVSGTIAAQAMAVATPVSPASGATVSSAHPVFTWTVPANEESDGIYMATAPATTPEGRFHDENVVDLDAFLNNETSWSPTSPLAANTYWWLVWTPDRETFDSFFSSPISFTIPAEADITSVRTRRYTFINWLDITVRYRANTESATVRARIKQGGRVIATKRHLDEFVLIGETNSATLTWTSPRRIQGRHAPDP